MMSKTFARSLSSCVVKRSNSKVAMPLSLSASATILLRGLKRLDPLPCAKVTSADAPRGMLKAPPSPSGGMSTSRVSVPPGFSLPFWRSGDVRSMAGSLLLGNLSDNRRSRIDRRQKGVRRRPADLGLTAAKGSARRIFAEGRSSNRGRRRSDGNPWIGSKARASVRAVLERDTVMGATNHADLHQGKRNDLFRVNRPAPVHHRLRLVAFPMRTAHPRV